MRNCCLHAKPSGAWLKLNRDNVCYAMEDGTGGTIVYFNVAGLSGGLESVNVQEPLQTVSLILET